MGFHKQACMRGRIQRCSVSRQSCIRDDRAPFFRVHALASSHEHAVLQSISLWRHCSALHTRVLEWAALGAVARRALAAVMSERLAHADGAHAVPRLPTASAAGTCCRPPSACSTCQRAAASAGARRGGVDDSPGLPRPHQALVRGGVLSANLGSRDRPPWCLGAGHGGPRDPVSAACHVTPCMLHAM